MIAPDREELGGDLIFRVPNNFSDEGELLLSDLIPDGQDVEKYLPKGGVRDVVFNYLCDSDFEDLPHVSVKKNL